MTVYELFIEMLKLILKGKGTYRIFAYLGWVGGILPPDAEDEESKRIILW